MEYIIFEVENLFVNDAKQSIRMLFEFYSPWLEKNEINLLQTAL